MDDLDDNTELVVAGSAPTDQSDEELDRAEPRLRLELLSTIFAANPVQLKDFEPPSECYQYLDQTADIFSKYLYYTVFHVKVWISFDANENVFFDGARSAACGKLQLPERVYKSLASVDPTFLKLQQVCLEIGTPFRTLAVVDLAVVEDGPDGATVRAECEMAREHADKHRLNKYIQYCCRWIEHIGLVHGVDGIALEDLADFASLFRRDREAHPGRDDDWEEPVYGGGEWTGVEKPRSFTRYMWS